MTMHNEAGRISATIELAPKQALENEELGELIPLGTAAYLTDLGTGDDDETVAAARRLRDLGLEPVPHIASRRLPSREALFSRVERLVGEADVRDVLIIGGGLDKPAGEFTSTHDVLTTGVLEKNGIRRVGIAGHPEGSPDFSAGVALDALRMKGNYAAANGLDMRIVTQFGFDPEGMVEWVRGLKSHGVDLPVHLGVAGPATLKTLLRYAAFCGVGPSMSFLKRNALKIANLATTQSPEQVVGPIEAAWRAEAGGLVGMHVFPFGGVAKSSVWLRERGSWHDGADVLAAE